MRSETGCGLVETGSNVASLDFSLNMGVNASALTLSKRPTVSRIAQNNWKHVAQDIRFELQTEELVRETVGYNDVKLALFED
jgi:hypothetical protein